MTSAQEFVEDFLAHYASEYYDPAKAHEYYLRTRELKGRRSTSGLTVKGDKSGNARRKEAWGYTKNQIGEAKKADAQKIAEQNKQFLEQARNTAKARREEISNKLKSLLETITANQKAFSEQLDQDKKASLDDIDARQEAKTKEINAAAARKIDALPPIPEGVNDATRARLAARRAQDIARIRGDANREIRTAAGQFADERDAVRKATTEDRSALSKDVSAARKQSSTEATASRESVSTELKATVEKARADYNARKESLKAQYEATEQREYDAIKQRV